jgi:hypothetical protein
MVTIETNLWPHRFKGDPRFTVSYTATFDTHTVIVNMVYSGYLPQWSASFAVPHGTATGHYVVRVQQAEQDTVNLVTVITACKNISLRGPKLHR